MITYEVPARTASSISNGKPLCYAGLAAQKNHLALYLMAAYTDTKAAARLKSAFAAAGKKLDMGKSCIRFQRADDLPLDAIGEAIAAVPPEEFVAIVAQARKR